MAAVAREGAIGTSGRAPAVVTSNLGATVSAAKGATDRRTSNPRPRVQVLVETVHPTIVPPTIQSQPMRLASATFTVTPAPDDMASSSESEVDTQPETQPARLELADVASARSPEFDLARRALQPRPQPIAAVPQPPAHALLTSRHEVPKLTERPSDERLVSFVLQQYRQAYESLDVSAAQNVWPTVDARALGAAFRQLSAQRVTFDSCGVSVSGSGSQATARCTGQAEYMPKVGGRRTFTASGEWVFDLQKENAAWRIINANANIK
jgi:hypothetical protein